MISRGQHWASAAGWPAQQWPQRTQCARAWPAATHRLSCRLAQASLHVDGQGVGYNKIISTPGTCTYVGFLKAGGEGRPVGHWLGFR